MAAFQYELRMLCILLWKSWRIRKHRKWQTLIEIASPVLLVLLLVCVKAVMEPDYNAPVRRHPIAMSDSIKALCTGIGCSKSGKEAILAYAPQGSNATALMEKVKERIKAILAEDKMSLEIRGFNDRLEIEALASTLAKTGKYEGKPRSLTGAIIFLEDPDPLRGDLKYKIRLTTSRFITAKPFEDVDRAGPGRQYLEYETSGFLGLQLVIDNEFIKLVADANPGSKFKEPSWYTEAIAYPKYHRLEKSHYTMVLGTLLPAAIILGFVYMISISIQIVVEERVTGVKKFLTMLGLNHVCYWIGWFLDLFVIALIAMALIVMILTTNFSDGAAIVFTSTSFLWTFLLMYAFAAVWFCFFIANLLRSSSHAVSLAALIWISTFVFPALLVGTRQRYLATQFLLAICPNMCLYWGFNMIATWESRVIGAQWTNMLEYASEADSLNMASMFAMLIFNGWFYFILTLTIRPTLVESRKLKNPFRLLYDALYDDTKFPEFVKCCCYCCRRKTSLQEDESTGEVKLDSAVGELRLGVLKELGLVRTAGSERSKSLAIPVEDSKIAAPQDVGVKIKKLSKSFYSDRVLKGFSCDFAINEISCILGDAGSGKSVMVDILLGILKADEGTAHINDYDIQDYLTDAKRCVGLCPQKNMIFHDLTVMEHLILFGWLKGKDWDSTLVQAKHVANLLNLTDELKIPGKKLSKSSKRLLSCAIALMGNPKVVILDDPTHDMEPESRKIFWNVLMKYKEGRTVIFTSTSIETACEVSDKIAVLCDGRLRCFGSPIFLNSVFGDGYTIKLSIFGSGERLVRMVCQELGQAQVKNRTLTVGGEDVTFLVPKTDAVMFPKLFYQLYDNKDALNILTVHIDSLAIEDVFHSVHEMREFRQDSAKSSVTPKESRVIDPSSNQTSMESSSFFIGVKSVGVCLTLRRISALMKKNYRLSCAKIIVLVFQVIIPLALILSGINGANRALRNQDVRHYGQVKITLDKYKNPITYFHIQDQEYIDAYKAVVPDSQPTNNTKVSTQLGQEKNIAKYRHQYIVAVEEETGENTEMKITAMYSTVPLNSPPLAVNLATRAMLKIANPNSSQTISVENHPLKSGFPDESTSSVTSDSGTAALLKSFCLYFVFAVALICGMVAIKPMIERTTGSHHLQAMTGINPLTFWFSYLVLDGLYVAIWAGIALGIVFFAQERFLFTTHGGALALVTILLSGGFSAIAFGYFFSQMVSNAATAFGWLNLLHLLATVGSYIMYYLHDGVNNLISEIYYWAMIPFPIPLMVHSLYIYGKVVVDNMACELLSEDSKSEICEKAYVNLPAYSCCAKCTKGCFHARNYFYASSGYQSYTLMRDLIIMGGFALFYFILVVLMDFSYFRKVNRYFLSASSEAFNPDKGEKDPSAAQEAEHVRKLIGMGANIPEDEGLLVDGLCKNHGRIGIYSQVSFSVKKGECFGLLGLNGSGKSMVFKTLAGEFLPAVGDANIPPYGMLGHRRLFTASIGYCPQENCIFSGLSARETLELYGALRGICRADLQAEVTQWLSALGLENESNLVCGKYTEGMKRRLCVAVALIGNPKVIILDDPSRDIDPSMKKHIWSTLQRLQKDGKSILLASQNIHECENLCGKLGLMLHGKLQYVGTTAEIKSKFLNGYTVTFKLTKRYSVDDASELETVTELRTNIEAILDDAVYRDAFANTLKYLIPHKSQNWGSIVEKLEKIRSQMSDSVAYYSMTESSLEEVFKAMADLDVDQTNELPGTNVSHFQRCCMGQCCSDDYS